MIRKKSSGQCWKAQNDTKEAGLESDLDEGVRPILEGTYRYLTEHHSKRRPSRCPVGSQTKLMTQVESAMYNWKAQHFWFLRSKSVRMQLWKFGAVEWCDMQWTFWGIDHSLVMCLAQSKLTGALICTESFRALSTGNNICTVTFVQLLLSH